MKKIIATLLFGLQSVSFANPFPSNKLTFGDGTASNKIIEFKKGITSSANPKIRWNDSTSAIQFSNDGSSFFDIGAASTFDSPLDIQNMSIAASVGSNALTVALKDKSGSDPSAGSPVKVAMRNATAATGTYNVRSVTGALSVVVSSGSTLGHVSGVVEYVYVYLLDNAGTLELAVSGRAVFDSSTIQTSTAEGGAGAADSGEILYSTTARSNVPIRLIGRIKVTEATAGTWATAPSEVATNANTRQGQSWHVDANIASTNASNIDLGTSAVTAYAGMANANLQLTRNAGSAEVWIGCSSTNDSSGTTCSAGSEQPDISFTPPLDGYYRACVAFSHSMATTTSGAARVTFEVVQTSNTSQTISKEGGSRVFSSYSSSSSEDVSLPHNLCGVFLLTGGTRTTLRLFREMTATGGNVSPHEIKADADANNGQRDVHWEVYPLP